MDDSGISGTGVRGCVVLKFGGTSVSTPERIRNAARIVGEEVLRLGEGGRVAVVVSAIAGETDRLISLVREVSPTHDIREFDAIASTGEVVSAALLSIALQDIGLSARSWSGWQLPVYTSSVHGAARIEGIETAEIGRRMEQGEIAVIAGYQGLERGRNRVTTLGRGGGDTTAVALAVALGAMRCDIYTDVEGVYTADPRRVPGARLLSELSYVEMLELSALGTKVLQARAAELAAKNCVRLRILSSLVVGGGTMLVSEEGVMERPLVRGIAYSVNEARVTLIGLPNRPGVARAVFAVLDDFDINIDLIVQTAAERGRVVDITFTAARSDADRVQEALARLPAEFSYERISWDDKVAKISVVGIGMRSHSGVARTFFDALAQGGVNVEAISTSEIRISVLISEDQLEHALRIVHTAYGLDGAVRHDPTFSQARDESQSGSRSGARGSDLGGL
ncbi:MAG: aspartate kinase [Alphaproteobacteria bacterium]